MEQQGGVSERRTSLRRKYRSLGLGELVAAATFAAVAILLLTPRLGDWKDAAALWAALSPLLVILVQAGMYWLLARRWVARAPMPSSIAKAYRALKVLNVLVLAAGLLGIVVWLPTHGLFALSVVSIWLFAVIEYVNYFIVRLAYPLHQWPSTISQWRRPRLLQDLNRTPPDDGHSTTK